MNRRPKTPPHGSRVQSRTTPMDVVLVPPTPADGEHCGIEVVPPMAAYEPQSHPPALRTPTTPSRKGRSTTPQSSTGFEILLPTDQSVAEKRRHRLPRWLPKKRDNDRHIRDAMSFAPLEYIVVPAFESGVPRHGVPPRPPLSPASPHDLDQHLPSSGPSPNITRMLQDGLSLSPPDIPRPRRMTTIDNAWKSSRSVIQQSHNSNNSNGSGSVHSMMYSDESESMKCDSSNSNSLNTSSDSMSDGNSSKQGSTCGNSVQSSHSRDSSMIFSMESDYSGYDPHSDWSQSSPTYGPAAVSESSQSGNETDKSSIIYPRRRAYAEYY